MATSRKYLDYTGLQQFWAYVKEYFRNNPTSTAENLANGIEIVFKDSRDDTEILGTLTWNEETKTQSVSLKMPAIDAQGPLSYNEVSGVLTIDLSDYLNADQTNAAIAAATARALTFKGVVNELPSVDTAGLKNGDIYIVGSKEYIFVAATEEPAAPAHWEELGFTVDLSGYYTKTEANSTFVATTVYTPKIAELEEADSNLDSRVTVLESDVNTLNGKVDIIEDDLGGLKTRVSTAEANISSLDEGLTQEIAARELGDEIEAGLRDEAIDEAFNSQLHVITYNNISGLFEETFVSTAEELAEEVEKAYNGGTVNVTNSVVLSDSVTLNAGQSVVVNLEKDTAVTGSSTSPAFILDDVDAELLVVGDGEVGTTVGIKVNAGTVTINGGQFTGSSRGIQIGELVKPAEGEEPEDVPVTVTINEGKFGGIDEGTGYATSQAGVILFGGNVIINGGRFVNTWYALSGNGTKDLPDSDLTINGGYFEATGTASDNHGAAIYWPNSGTLTINGGEFKGGAAVYAKSGKVVINGGTFESDYAATEADVAGNKASTIGGMRDYQYSGGGFYCTGDAIIIDYCCKYPSGDPNVFINKNIITRTLASGAHGVGIYYGRGVDSTNANGTVEIADGLNIDTHVYDNN